MFRVLKALKSEKGFTLVEVIAAFAVLMIISGSLLQFFLSSTIANARASDLDKGNMLCVRIGEAFKLSPDADVLNTVIDTEIGAVPGPSPTLTDNGSTTVATYADRFLDMDFHGVDESAITNQGFKLQISVTTPKNPDTLEGDYYPDPLWSGEMKPNVLDSGGGTVNYTLKISSDTTDSNKATVALSPDHGGNSGSTGIPIPTPDGNGIHKIPIVIKTINTKTDKEFDPNSIKLEIRNEVSNGSMVRADVYIVGADTSKLEVNPTAGLVSYSSVSGLVSTTALYSMNIKLVRLVNQSGTLVEKNVVVDNDIEKYFSTQD